MTSKIFIRSGRDLSRAGMMRQAAAVLLLALVSTGAAADVWFEVGANDKFTAYADPATIKRQGDMATMWAMFDYKTAQTTSPGKKHLSLKLKYEYDCKEGRARALTATAFAEGKAKGEQVAESNMSLAPSAIAPGSIDESLFKYACTK
jgi:hypothetical protein